MVDTSLDSWRRLQPTIQTKRVQVLEAISFSSGITCSDVEQRTGLRHQTVSARIKELLDSGEIEVIGTYEDTETNRTVRIYGAKT